MLRKGANRMKEELNILNFLRATRLHALQIRSLLSKKQYALSRKLAEYILTDEESEDDPDIKKTPSNKLKGADTVL